MQSHPYIYWNTANASFKYRKANGNYKKIEDIKKIHLINTKTYLKIAPYLITILVLVILTIYKEGKTGAPGNIGRPFFRENR